MPVEQTPLEQLTEMNQRAAKTRKRRARPRDPTPDIERFYRTQLRSLVRAMSRKVKEEVLPIIKEEKRQYRNIGDASPADRIERAARETETEPTPAQIESGNYRKGKCALHGLLITIENPRGSTRSGVDAGGHEWHNTMPHHYGYVRRTEGNDGDSVDVFIGPDPDSPRAFIVDQSDPNTGSFDEHKIMLGFPDEDAARKGYLAAYERGWQGLSEITEVSLAALRAWLNRGDMSKPAAGSVPEPLTGDSVPTMDGWADRIIQAISAIAASFLGGVFEQQYQRLAQRTVSMAEAASTDAFLKSVNEAVGVDMAPILDNEGMRDYLDVATQQNVQLIKSVPEEFFTGIENAVLGGVRDGRTPSAIAKQIQQQTGVHERKAVFIARDQTAKLNSEIMERRQRQAGIKYYRVVTAGDERVTGKPGGKYPNAKISCWGIARKDVGYGPGVYRWDKGASWGGQTGLHPGRHHPGCRCVAVSAFEWELPEKARK